MKYLMCAVCLFVACGVAEAAKAKPPLWMYNTVIVVGCTDPVEYGPVRNIKISGSVLTFESLEWAEDLSGYQIVKRSVPECWEIAQVVVNTQNPIDDEVNL